VRVYDFGRLDEVRHYLALELVEGRTLREVLAAEGPMSARRAVHLLLPVAGALAEAHAAGIIHRDLKPENLMWQRSPGLPEWLRLLDFGIAAMEPQEGEARLTRTGEVFGTPEFMAPEQALARPVTPATDVWAMGAVLQTVLTGRAPFTGSSAPEILFKIVKDAPPALPESVPADFRALVAACLAKEPTMRPPDATALVRAMASLVAPVAEVVREPPPLPPPPPVPAVVRPPVAIPVAPSRRTFLTGRTSRAALGGFVAGALVFGGLVALTGPASTTPPAADAGVAPDRLAEADQLLTQGQAQAALAWIDAHEAAGPVVRRLLLRGLARLGTGAVKTGLVDIQTALAGDPGLAADPRIVPALVAHLDDKDADDAVPMLAGPLASRARDALLETAGGPRYRARWRAVDALEKVGYVDDAHAARLAALRRDLRADDCELRRQAARRLAAFGDAAAIPDLERADRRPFLDNLCMGDTLRDAIRTLRTATPKRAD
jgi:hypothetical protein